MKAILYAGLLASAVYQSSATPSPDDFDWTTVEPSTSLNYTTCYDGLKCARLLVPLDWLDPANPARVTLAVIARPAVVDESDPSFGGSIIVNPGGPSGSGVGFVLRAGELIQRTADGNKKFEILSFDPRGVAFTTPSSDCYRDEFARGISGLEGRARGALDSGLPAVKAGFAVSTAFGRLCEGANSANDIRGFMSTSSVARDMIEIVDKLEELRGDSKVIAVATDLEKPDQARLELRSDKSVPRIQYWGFSYGSVLGNYLVSMFPGRIGRVILEAVEDVYDYASAEWAMNLPDTTHVLSHLWETCFEAGDRCALYKASDDGPQDIQRRVEAFIDELDVSPSPYVSNSSVVYITKQDILDTIFGPLYQPLRDFPKLATTLAEALAGNLTQIYLGLHRPERDDSCPLGIPTSYTWAGDAQAGIACGDGKSQTNLTVSEMIEHVERLKADSPEFGAGWSEIRLTCRGWRFQPKYRFMGPWVSPAADPSLVEGRPAAPVLFVSSRYDPVTPLVNAYEMAKGHPGSRVLIQDNMGHGSLMSPGKCREDHIKKYFETGELPPEGTVCAPDCKPFQECPQALGAMGVEDVSEPSGRRAPLELF
ncbi:hypothetical protein GQ53DRAFT_680118 [Thozetella sp. PMI_491]|nr:hypothetical protein GQ53DRAFT_680118 [Thozetella sp. PMI_491]